MKKWLWIIPIWVMLFSILSGIAVWKNTKKQEEHPDMILRYAENQPDGYPTTEAAYVFARMVEERTDGRIRVCIYSGGQLGSESSVIEQMMFGGIDFSRISVSQLSEEEDSLRVLFLPYLYRNEAHMWRVLNGSIGEEFLSCMEDRGLIGLSWFDAGERCFYTKAPVKSLEDLAGLKLRVQNSAIMTQLVESLGAEPVQLAYGEVYAALQQNEIDGAENNLSSYIAMNHYSIAPYFLMDNHCRIPEMQLISTVAMEKLAKLDASFPDIIRRCARDSAEIQHRLWQQTQAEALEQIDRAGCTVTRLDAQSQERFRQAAEAVYRSNANYSDIIHQIQKS